MTFKVLLAASLAIAVSAPALAKDGGSSQDAQKEKKVCRIESVTGSLISKQRICRTQGEWDAIAANTRKTLGDMNRHQNLGSDSGSGNGALNTAGL